MLHPLLLLVVLAATSTGASPLEEKFNPVADPRAVLTVNQARFTVLTPALIRMEWSPDGAFEDRASLVFLNRALPVPDFHHAREADRLTIQTEELILRYRDDAEPFNSNNLTVEMSLNGRAVVWTPGLADDANLKGTYRTLDTVSGGVPLPPGLLSRDGWAVVDDSRRPVFDQAPNAAELWATARTRSDALDWYFFGYGHGYKRALRDFTRVAGRVPLPPRFAFGAWWSRYWAYSDRQLRELVRAFAEHDVPLDVLVVDMDWHLDGWTGYTWNPKYFPDPEGFLKWVREQGLRTTLNLHPADGVGKHEKAFTQVAEAMGLEPEEADRVPFDCTDPRYMKAYFEHLHQPLERQGVDFWWIDWQQGAKTKLDGLDPLWWLNHLHWTDMERRAEQRGRRPLIFSRWGGLGNHRYPIGFSGDTYCDWPSLAFQPYFTATAGNVCYPYWSHDIGGHQPGPVDAELYARWIQWGVFSPILRTHTTKNPKAERRIWKFPQETLEAARKAFHLRYELLPYIYSAARQCTDSAVPLCRPLYYEWPELDEAYAHPGEYLFGDDLLVAPVTRPADPVSGCASACVWLPPGQWTHWFTGCTYAGPKTVWLQVPLDEIPLFVRSGAIIPAQPRMNRTDEKPVDPLMLHIWPGESGRTRVYEDDGRTVRYRKGECAWTPVSQKPVGELAGDLDITIGPVEGRFDGLPAERRYELRIYDVPPDTAARLNDSGMPESKSADEPGWAYDYEQFSLIVRVGPQATDQEVHVRLPVRLSVVEQEFGGRFPDGLRGQVKRVREVAGMLERGSSGDVGLIVDFPAVLAKNPRQTGTCFELLDNAARALPKLITESAMDTTQKRRCLMRLLGLQCDFEVAVPPANGRGLRLHGVIALSPAFKMADSPRGRLEISPPKHWTVQGRAAWDFPDLAGPDPIPIETTLLPDGDPQTTLLQTRFALTAAGFDMEVPQQRLLLPSINRWWAIGPFEAEFDEGLERVFPPEGEIELHARYEAAEGRSVGWSRIQRDLGPTTDLMAEFFVNLLEVYPHYNTNAVAYALAYLRAPEDVDASLAVGTDDGVVIWLNGREIHRHPVGRPYQSKEDRIAVRLKQGTNTLLLKVNQGGGGWGFCVHVETPDGRPMTEVTAHLEPPQ